MELQDIAEVLAELDRQGFEINLGAVITGDALAPAARISKDGRVITVFMIESQNLQMRLYALKRCRDAGFFWPD